MSGLTSSLSRALAGLHSPECPRSPVILPCDDPYTVDEYQLEESVAEPTKQALSWGRSTSGSFDSTQDADLGSWERLQEPLGAISCSQDREDVSDDCFENRWRVRGVYGALCSLTNQHIRK